MGDGEILDALRERLATIARDVSAGRYKAGPWQKLVDELRTRPQADRLRLAGEVSRVSQALHMRNRRKTMSVTSALALEVAATIAGAFLIVAGVRVASNVLALVGAVIWVATFQPLIKVTVGRALGVRYDYAYLYGSWEPRFKMNFGSYLAAGRPARLALHLSGTVGSPLAAGVCSAMLASSLRTASVVCWIAMWVVIATNVIPFMIGLAGIRRLRWWIAEGSAGSAALELREAIGLKA